MFSTMPLNPSDVTYEAIAVCDVSGNLPAHIGAIRSADEGVLRVLLKAYPAALDKSNCEGKVLAVLAQACCRCARACLLIACMYCFQENERTHEWFSGVCSS